MKQMSRKMISLVFAAILMILVFDSGMTVAAEEKKIAVGVEYRINDVVTGGKNSYYLVDDVFGSIAIDTPMTLCSVSYRPQDTDWVIKYEYAPRSYISVLSL
ncbi:MAG: hypothetical protein K6A70_09955 [Erysipelotrichaceae bacterium]|nr:hypothetical protein [Erysipelotrichaceae bacterium]